MKNYIAYGSNLNVTQMMMRCPTAKLVGTSTIAGFRLVFKGSKTGSYLTIEEDKSSIVPVAIWSIGKSDESHLDIYEGFPSFYIKKNFRLDVLKHGGIHETLDCFAYVMVDGRPYGIPSEYYVSTCMDGYKYFRFNTNFLDKALDDTLLMIDENRQSRV